MKFRFCGDGDCPDWVLTEIPTLTRLPSMFVFVVADLHQDETPLRTRDQGSGWGGHGCEADVQGAVAALRWLLGSASKHSVDADSFSSELQQLGLPREHAQAAAKVFGEHVAAITAHLKTLSLRELHRAKSMMEG
ncbi:hypothetical protein FOCC_FOCC000236 [Frankliniella occidentalis]|nr:hypothetical protein FOCC_FOCC000236 [Frankliniella occidentalis]